MKFDSTDLSIAKQYDEQDSLKNFRNKFIINKNEIYLNGNSLGLLPFSSKEKLNEVINLEWGDRAVRSWGEGWINLPSNIGNKIASIIGANENEVLVADSTSINLYKLAYVALKLQNNRMKIVSDEFNFPSDLYVLQSIIKQFDGKHSLRLVKSNDQVTIDVEEIKKAIDENTALVTLSHVCFRTSYLYDMKEITKYAHQKGALVLWDLSHSAGVVDINLTDAKVDLAIGCTYKYINGGPGSPAYLFVKKELQEKLESPIWGWLGDKNPFEFSLNFRPAEGIRKFQIGTPPILSLSAIEPGLDLIIDAGIENIREKSVLQTDYMIYLIEEKLVPLGFELLTVKDSAKRGSHIAISHKDAYSISLALRNNKSGKSIILDYRPGILRLSVNPLYNTFEEIWEAIDIITTIVKNEGYELQSSINEVT
jgi:kynureninase